MTQRQVRILFRVLLYLLNRMTVGRTERGHHEGLIREVESEITSSLQRVHG
jgi:hypothetical protein